MPIMTREIPSVATTANADFDAIVVGAGFGGLYMLHKLRDELGLKVCVFDRAGDVGGTWYWNRYPGARSDTESFVYCYSFDSEMLQDWVWSDRYPLQPEVLSYLEYVADRLELRRDIQFNCGVIAAHFNEDTNLWSVTTDTGKNLTAKYFVTALGLLSVTNVPDIKGLENFVGEQYHTGAWPTQGVSLEGKRVGVIGTGSTGVQCVTAIGPEAKHLTVFQRSPQYSVPARHGAMPKDFIAGVKANYEQVWTDVRNSGVAFGFEESQIPCTEATEISREKVFEQAWQKGGGFRFMFGTFNDIVTDRQSNEEAAQFIRSKISQIVKDPATAKMLTPTDLYAKRPLCDAGYYETYNRENVTLVDIKKDPIEEITSTGVQTTQDMHELDILIFATGFDAVDGSYTKIDIRGRNGIQIKDKWADGPSSYLGMANSDFPNMFMILGPNGPFTNLPPSIETQVEWVSDLISHMQDTGMACIEATSDAEATWTETCEEIANFTLFPQAESWIFGANIPGKPNKVMFYMAGLGSYRQVLHDVADGEYEGFTSQ
ncbi:MAG: NAD(P)/FAD-dependent oxidoreductase [bacterium]